MLVTPPSNQPGEPGLHTHAAGTWQDAGMGNSAVPERPTGDVLPGASSPLGALWDGTGTNFALWSAGAHAVDLCLFDSDGTEHRQRLEETTHQVWHGRLPGVGPG